MIYRERHTRTFWLWIKGREFWLHKILTFYCWMHKFTTEEVVDRLTNFLSWFLSMIYTHLFNTIYRQKTLQRTKGVNWGSWWIDTLKTNIFTKSLEGWWKVNERYVKVNRNLTSFLLSSFISRLCLLSSIYHMYFTYSIRLYCSRSSSTSLSATLNFCSWRHI